MHTFHASACAHGSEHNRCACKLKRNDDDVIIAAFSNTDRWLTSKQTPYWFSLVNFQHFKVILAHIEIRSQCMSPMLLFQSVISPALISMTLIMYVMESTTDVLLS